MHYKASVFVILLLTSCLRDQNTADDHCSKIYPIFQDGLWGGIDKTGSQVVPLEYDWLYYNPFQSSFLIAEKDTSKMIITLEGTQVYVSKSYDERLVLYRDSFLVINHDDTLKYELVSDSPYCQDILGEGSSPEPRWENERVCNYYFGDRTSNIVQKFRRCSSFTSDGIALVIGKDFWGYLDLEGVLIWRQEVLGISDFIHLMENPIRDRAEFETAYEQNSAVRETLRCFNLLFLNFESGSNQDFNFARYQTSIHF